MFNVSGLMDVFCKAMFLTCCQQFVVVVLRRTSCHYTPFVYVHVTVFGDGGVTRWVRLSVTPELLGASSDKCLNINAESW